MKFHTYGDSHASARYSVWTFTVAGASININHIGPKLMHTFSKDPIRLCNNFAGVDNGDWICFCFGEIDTRCHVNRFINESCTFENVIDTLVTNYMSALQQVASKFEHINICVFMIPPPSPEKRIFYEGCPIALTIKGTDAERLQYTSYFNLSLNTACSKNGFNFIYAYDYYADEHGFLLNEKSDGICHLKDPKPIMQIVRDLVKQNVMPSTVIAALVGRAGNQLFVFAAALAYAKRNSKHLQVLEGKYALTPWMHWPTISSKPFAVKDFCEPDFAYTEIPFMEQDIALHGYYQSEEYFMDALDEVRKHIQHPDPESLMVKCELIRSAYPGRAFVGVHCRYGDYVGNQMNYAQLTDEYYASALTTTLPDSVLLLYTDDFERARARSCWTGFTVHEIHENDVDTMGIVASLCTHHVIANSSYSWWSAHLSGCPSQQISMPCPWFGSSSGMPRSHSLYKKGCKVINSLGQFLAVNANGWVFVKGMDQLGEDVTVIARGSTPPVTDKTIVAYNTLGFCKSRVVNLTSSPWFSKEDGLYIRPDVYTESLTASKILYVLSLLAIFKNEAVIMKEWLDHYQSEGVEHFYMIDNGSTDEYADIIEPYIKAGKVTLWVDETKQAQAYLYNKYMMPHMHETEWLIVCDLDEFVYAKTSICKALVPLLADMPNLGAIGIPWKMFGSSGYIVQPHSVIASFTKRSNEITPFGKCILRANCVLSLSIHYHDLKPGYLLLMMTPFFNESLQLNHYCIQSWEWFSTVKAQRGDTVNPHNAKYFKEHDTNDLEDSELANKKLNV
jgi:hypothetical protein